MSTPPCRLKQGGPKGPATVTYLRALLVGNNDKNLLCLLSVETTAGVWL